MKRLNKTHIFHIFFGLLMFLPFISILSRVIYVQSNKNAKDSYSGYYEITYKYESNQVNSVNDIVEGNIYEFELSNHSLDEFLDVDENVYFKLLSTMELNEYAEVNESLSPSELSANLYIEFYCTQNNNMISVYTSENDYAEGNYALSIIYNTGFTNNFVVQVLGYNCDSLFATYTDYNEIESVNLTGTLDNAFDYSISKFIEDNNFKINFFSWFEDLFLVQNGGVNALYLSFANWYMCYALLVSTGYLLFLILMWFINYVRKILEGGNSFGHGGF